MKINLSSFVDYQSATLVEQESLVEKLKLQSVVIRKIDGKKLLDFDDAMIQNLLNLIKNKEVIAVDPLLQNGSVYDTTSIEKYEKDLDEAASKAKLLKAKSLVYRVPLFDDIMEDNNHIMTIIKRQVSIVKKYKIDVLVMPDNNHKSSTYRLIFENLKDTKVKMIYHPIYFYKGKEAAITAYRLLRDYIGMFIVDDCDELGTPRLISKGTAIDLKEIFKKFITNNFEGSVVLDSNLTEVLLRAKDYKWFDKTFSKVKKNEIKVYEDYISINQDISVFQVLKMQMLVLNLVFFNKKTL